MKKLFAILALSTLSFNVLSQTIGDHLNDIREKKSEGVLLGDPGSYYYSVEDDSKSNVFLYYLNDKLVCNRIIIRPRKEITLQGWVQVFNQGWVVIDNTHWMYYKKDGGILEVRMIYVDDTIGYVFEIREANQY